MSHSTSPASRTLYGSREQLEKDAIRHLFEVYVKINADAEKDPNVKVEAAVFFRPMEDGNEAALADCRVWRELSIRKYAEEYARLNVHFDVYTGESMVGKASQDLALKVLGRKGLIDDEEGAEWVNLEKYKLGNAVPRKKVHSVHSRWDDGTSIYLMHDISGAIERYEKYKFDKMICVISQQRANDLQLVNYGLMLGMSTRRGTVVFLDQSIHEAGVVMHEQMKKNEENLQYAYVCISISCKNPELLLLPPPVQIDTGLLTELATREIIFLLGSYPDVVKTALRTHEPSGVVTFAFRLSHAISSAWETVVVKGETDVAKARGRMWMCLCTWDVLGAAMRLLTLKPLERM
ncbi:Nucleotidylyl transferase [Laetiporus sulphureus 93-53]|uniref:arginine--tRNA ligase n=1 Tax=Laetiporus sulphureus 93-53 TaxID=1314785 RepID=A0A165BW31_9APHY|nr:Nucleotidylyl transferase [Laetiporus sulphureus 93-53]KZT01757.1 Nucleotidylyl transferase [Laetiporus sulphureus 93-53]